MPKDTVLDPHREEEIDSVATFAEHAKISRSLIYKAIHHGRLTRSVFWIGRLPRIRRALALEELGADAARRKAGRQASRKQGATPAAGPRPAGPTPEESQP